MEEFHSIYLLKEFETTLERKISYSIQQKRKQEKILYQNSDQAKESNFNTFIYFTLCIKKPTLILLQLRIIERSSSSP